MKSDWVTSLTGLRLDFVDQSWRAKRRGSLKDDTDLRAIFIESSDAVGVGLVLSEVTKSSFMVLFGSFGL